MYCRKGGRGGARGRGSWWREYRYYLLCFTQGQLINNLLLVPIQVSIFTVPPFLFQMSLKRRGWCSHSPKKKKKCRWCKVGWRLGVFLPDQRRKPRGFWQRQVHSPVPHSSFLSSLLNWYWFFPIVLAFHLDFTFVFFSQGLWSLQQASQLWEEAWKLEERAQQLETEGWG